MSNELRGWTVRVIDEYDDHRSHRQGEEPGVSPGFLLALPRRGMCHQSTRFSADLSMWGVPNGVSPAGSIKEARQANGYQCDDKAVASRVTRCGRLAGRVSAMRFRRSTSEDSTLGRQCHACRASSMHMLVLQQGS